MRNSYSIGTVFLAGLETNERFSCSNRGGIFIGGDRGDVEAVSALNSEKEGEEGVALEDVTLFTTLDLDDSEIEGEIREIVQACYDSIQEETFNQQRS